MLFQAFAFVAFTVAAGDHATFHPTDADLYVAVPDAAALLRAYAAAPLVKTLSDPSVAKIGKVASDLGVDLGALFSGLLPVADPKRPDDRFWPWSALEEMSMSLAGIDGAPRTSAAPDAAWNGWMILDFQDAAAATQALAAIGSTSGITTVAVKDDVALELGGQKLVLSRFEIGGGGFQAPMWFTRADARLIGGIGGASPEALSARVAHPESSFVERAKLLASDAQFETHVGVTIARVWSDLESFALPAAIQPESRRAKELFDRFAPAFLPFYGAKGRWRLSLVGDRFVSESLYERLGAARDLDGLYGAGPIDHTTAQRVPKEAVGTWITKFDPVRVEAELERLIASLHGPMTAESKDGKPRAKLSDGLGDSAAVYMLPFAGVQSLQKGLPRAAMAIGLTDAAKFQAGFEAWIARVREIDPKLEVESKPYRKLPMYTLTWPGIGGAGEGDDAGSGGGASMGLDAMRPTIAILSDRVLVTLERGVAQAEIRRIEAKSTDAHAIAAEGLIPRDAFEASTMDWGGLVGKLYDLGRGFLPMLAQGTEKSLDLDGLPTSTELFRFFQPSFSWSKRVEGGTYTRSESSFGPETPLSIVALGVLGVSSGASVMPGRAERAATRVAPEPKLAGEPSGVNTAPVEVDAARKATLEALRSVKTALAVYRAQSGRFPDTLDELLKGTTDFPQGFLDGGVVPKDGWNRALVYSARDAGLKYALRSRGADGADQDGAGDDVNVP